MIESPWNLMPVKTFSSQGSAAINNKKEIESAAAGFESVLVREWLRQARATSFSGESAGSSAGYLEMADDQLASFVSRNGGFGFARQLADQLLNQVRSVNLIEAADSAVKGSDGREGSRE